MYARTAPEWELVGGDPTPGDPCAYDTLSSFFGETAHRAGEVSCWLRRLAEGTDETIWRGEAADAFRADISELPRKLDKLHDSYQDASEALLSYGARLRQLQGQADIELGKAACADEEHAAAIRAMTDPQGVTAPVNPEMIGSAPPLGGPGPCGSDAAEGPAARLAAARAAVERIRQERETAEAQAVAKLEHASDIGMQNKGLLDRISGWVGDRLDDARDFHHKMLRAIGDLADRLSDVLTIVAIALVAVAAVAFVAGFVLSTAGVGGAFLPGLLALSGKVWAASGTAFVWAAWAKLTSVGANAESKLLYHDPDVSWGQLAKDGALAGLTAAGGPVKAAKFVRDSRYVQAAAWKMGELAVSGNRVALFSVKAVQFGGTGVTQYNKLHDKILGTSTDPTLAGMIHKGGTKAHKLWDKHKDDPLHIFTDPVQTSPGEWKDPDGVGVWVMDFGRAVARI
ncbi:MAG: putative T7SS-secreted protein [Actinomycetota bacterium]|jgi:uncharacterized protein YukE